MPELPVISGDKCIAALARAGYVVVRTKGSHVRLRCAGRKPVTVPRHDELDRGTLRSILRTVNMSIEEFKKLLN
jgi:predicted RNA binding protein YcfA (HicA-like mRNA interferase family)